MNERNRSKRAIAISRRNTNTTRYITPVSLQLKPLLHWCCRA
ncbi:MAG: hypothetical protein AB4426_02745 [Xenococcaceae cyanobacterium]